MKTNQTDKAAWMKPIAPRFSLETHGGVNAVIFYPNDGIDGVRIVLSDSAEPSTYNEQLTYLVREHAALVAVAAAAESLSTGGNLPEMDGGNIKIKDWADLMDNLNKLSGKLSNLAAVREEGSAK